MDDIYISSYKGQRSNSEPPRRSNGDDKMKKSKKRKKKRRSLPRKLFSLLMVVALLLGIAYAAVFFIMAMVDCDTEAHKNNVYVDASDLASSAGVTNILLVGVDARANENASRSDTMLLVSVDRTNSKIKLTSFLRDTWVSIPDHGYAKLNAACTYGGAQLVMDTIEYNYNIRIDNYMLVNFEAFTSIIDRLGGIEVEVTQSEAKYMRNTVHLTNVTSGNNVKLNGNEALWYCRIRSLDNDLMRTSRQRKVISAIINKVSKTEMLSLTGIVREVLPQIKTDMNPVSLTNLAMGSALFYLRYDILTQQIPADGTWSDGTRDGQSVLITDIYENQQILCDFLYK